MEFTRIGAFMQHLFDRASVAEQAAQIVARILEARSPRLPAVAQHMPGTPTANDQALQRFIAGTDLKPLCGVCCRRIPIADPWWVA